ncbi:MAG: VWA domain-containing protein [bacterium]|jgi:Mg-chelatase subunit ChlD|nr:VWA domain-containing protein [bacterium]
MNRENPGYSPLAYPRPSRRGWDIFFLLAIVFSVAVHLVFVYSSFYWEVADTSMVEMKVEKLFKVRIQDLQSRNFMSRPTSTQLRQEREIALQREMEKLALAEQAPVGQEIAALTPDLAPVSMPEWGAEDQESLFVQDQTAKDLITSELGKEAIQDFQDATGKDAVQDVVSTQRIPLTGRGSTIKTRIMADLPKDAPREDPVVSRSIATLLQMEDLAPKVPDMEIEEPPLELPPLTEILPSPDLMRASPGPASLKEEEKAKEEIKERFVRLDDLLDVQLFTYHHVGGEGYFRVEIRPKAMDQRRLQILPKDVLFALDVSASMGRRRMVVLKEQIKLLLQRLRPEDRFNVIGFKQNVRKFTQTLAPVSDDSLKLADKFIDQLEASGKTDIYTSLQPLVQLGTERARPLILLLFSDGRPTVGVVNSRNIINNLSRFLGPSTSIYSVGTGEDLNRYLLDMLAFRNRGLVAFEKDRVELPSVIQSVYGYIEDPVLLRIHADFTNIDKAEVYPKVLPDLYLKGRLNIWGRLKGEEKIVLRLVGEAFDERKEMIIELPVPEFDSGTYEIARNWAYYKAYHVIGKMVEEGEKPEYMNEIQMISRTYNIVTPYSSHVVGME